MRKFDTKVQHLKYKVLREVAKKAWTDDLLGSLYDIPRIIVPTDTPTARCCVYKERAIVEERVKLALGGDSNNPNVIEVIEIACDSCPSAGYEVTDSCRGCLAHRCEDVCKVGAITFDQHHVAHIDKTKCVNCGMCAKVCPFLAIVNHTRPCMNACKVKAISMKENGAAKIDNDKCINCGACVYHCPFGAISDKSYILDVIEYIKNKEQQNYNVYAIIAPAFASQFSYARPLQVVSGLKQLGFTTVMEAALGADIVATAETEELLEKGFLTSSCCPAFVRYVKNTFADLAPFVSSNLSPMATLAKLLKQRDPTAKIVFVGPCTAKKAEMKLDDVKDYVDTVITFEELQALFDSKNINIATLADGELDNASYFGRIFGRSGGLSESVLQVLKETGKQDVSLKAMVCNGIEECKIALFKKSKNLLDVNFIEGMACNGGCVGGAGCLTHSDKNAGMVNNFGHTADGLTIADSVQNIKNK